MRMRFRDVKPLVDVREKFPYPQQPNKPSIRDIDPGPNAKSVKECKEFWNKVFKNSLQSSLPDDSGNKAYTSTLPDDSGDTLPEFLKIREEVSSLPDKIGPEDFSHRKEVE